MHARLAFLFLFLLIGCVPPPTPARTLTRSIATSPPTSLPSATATLTPTFLPPLPSPSPWTQATSQTPQPFVIRTAKADLWDDPQHEGEYWHLQTQLLLGEKVLVLQSQDGWAYVVAVAQPSHKHELGYPGWLRLETLTPGWPSGGEYAVVMTPFSLIRTAPNGERLMQVYLDTRLPVEGKEGDWVQVQLPDGQRGWLPRRDVRLTSDPEAPVTPETLFWLAESLIGTPYRWGGTTSASLDCSGFVYRLFHAHGWQVPRDADDQALVGLPVVRTDLRRGDLIFTADVRQGPITHVAFYWGSGMILDASSGRGVQLRPLSEHLAENIWVTARRYLPGH